MRLRTTARRQPLKYAGGLSLVFARFCRVLSSSGAGEQGVWGVLSSRAPIASKQRPTDEERPFVVASGRRTSRLNGFRTKFR